MYNIYTTPFEHSRFKVDIFIDTMQFYMIVEYRCLNVFYYSFQEAKNHFQYARNRQQVRGHI